MLTDMSCNSGVIQSVESDGFVDSLCIVFPSFVLFVVVFARQTSRRGISQHPPFEGCPILENLEWNSSNQGNSQNQSGGFEPIVTTNPTVKPAPTPPSKKHSGWRSRCHVRFGP